MNLGLSRYSQMMTEAEVCSDGRLRLVIGASELRQARQNGEIAFLQGKRGVHLYHPDDLAAYLQRKEQNAWLNASGNIGATGSGELATRPVSMPAGTMPEDAAKHADHLLRKFSPKPKTGSSNLSDQEAQVERVLQIAS